MQQTLKLLQMTSLQLLKERFGPMGPISEPRPLNRLLTEILNDLLLNYLCVKQVHI